MYPSFVAEEGFLCGGGVVVVIVVAVGLIVVAVRPIVIAALITIQGPACLGVPVQFGGGVHLHTHVQFQTFEEALLIVPRLGGEELDQRGVASKWIRIRSITCVGAGVIVVSLTPTTIMRRNSLRGVTYGPSSPSPEPRGVGLWGDDSSCCGQRMETMKNRPCRYTHKSPPRLTMHSADSGAR